MGQKAEINETGYDLKGGKALIGGTAYAIKKGRTLKDGTGYDVKFAPSVFAITGRLNSGYSEYYPEIRNGTSVLLSSGVSTFEVKAGTTLTLFLASISYDGRVQVYMNGVKTKDESLSNNTGSNSYSFNFTPESDCTIVGDAEGTSTFHWRITTS